MDESNKFFNELNQDYVRMSFLYHYYALSHDITVTALWILYSVYQSKDICTQSSLCNMYLFPKQTVNSSVNNLIKKKYITLLKIPGIQNQKAITLTDVGKEFCAKVIKPLLAAEEKASLSLLEEERDILITLMNKTYSNLQEEINKI